mgnify:CR=1 FL=1
MSQFQVTYHVLDQIPQEASEQIGEGLDAANARAAPLDEVCPLACLARLPTNEIIGGAIGRTWGLCCEVQQVWVQHRYRRQGIGKQLLRELHRQAEERGCRTFFLETFSFQAPRLYESLGYEARLELKGFTNGVSKFFMVRELTSE